MYKTVMILLLILVALVQPVAATATLIDGVVEFDSETNLTDLLTSVGNVSQLSESGGVYTMHVPFSQNTSGFMFDLTDTTLHLNSDAAYLLYYNVSVTNSAILGWNVSGGVPSYTIPAEGRPFVLGLQDSIFVMSGGNLSYLGPGFIIDDPCPDPWSSWSYSSMYTCGYDGMFNVDGSTMIGNFGGFDGGNNNTFTNNTFIDGEYSEIYVGQNTTVINNTFTNSKAESIGVQAERNIVTHNTMSGNINVSSGVVYGISCEGCSNSTIAYNDITQYEIGIHLYTLGDDSQYNSIYNNVLYANDEYGLSTAFDTYITDGHNEFYNNQYYDNGIYGIYVKGSKGHTFTNETVYDNGEHGIYLKSYNDITFDSCNVSDSNGIYTDYYNYGTDSLIILDNINRSNIITSLESFTFTYTGAEYNTTNTIAASCTLIDNELVGTEFYNVSITAGSLVPSLIVGVTPSTEYALVRSDGIGVERVTSTVGGDLIFTTSLTAGDYNVEYGYYNFTFSDASVNPSAILTTATSIASITVTDYDGTIETVYANIDGINYSASNTAGDTWSYTYSPITAGTKSVIFYAQDNHGYWVSNDPSLNIAVTVPPSTGGTTTPITCAGVTCASYCVDTTYYYAGRCIDDTCEYDSQQNHPNCQLEICEGVTCEPFCLDGVYNFNGVCGFDGDCKFDSRVDAEMCPLIECDGIVCAAWCDGTTYNFNGTCVNDVCTFTTEENHSNCPLQEDVIDVWDMVKNLFFLVLILILFVAAYNEVLSK